MIELPTGAVTFLFTDIEGSTRWWQEHPAAMQRALADHDELLRGAIESHGGVVVKTTGDGAHAVFADARDAIVAAVAAQLALGAVEWPLPSSLRVRMGIHSGPAELRDGDYYGTAVNRAARLMSVAHGDQVVVSLVAEELARDGLPDDIRLERLGEYHLRDFERPEVLFQVEHPGLRIDFPPLRTIDRAPGKLPVRLTSFVGREEELAAVVAALDEARLLTLIGVGGVGKTRLALQAVTEVAIHYADGVWFCELAGVTDRAAVPEAVAACLDVAEQPGQTTTASLLSFLRTKRALLVLDNCEHVVDAAGSLAEAVIKGCAAVQVLATSREALAVDGEALRPVGSLGVPDERASPEEVAAAGSVRLFVERARAARPEFALDDAAAPAVADICRQLDGVPLAIELAAARVIALTPSEIALRLEHRFRLLTGGHRTALERHQTLRAAVDWSYALLTPAEARVFDRLGVFTGGCTLAAAETVVSNDGIEAADVLDLLSGLVARSTVVAEESHGTTRYRMHETMRQYARERLDADGDGDAVRRRHAEYFTSVAEAIASGVTGRDEFQWIDTVNDELANLRSALDWSIAMGEPDLALREALALGRFGLQRFSVYKFWGWLDLAASMPEARLHPLRPQVMALALIPYLVLSGNLTLAAERLHRVEVAFADIGLEPSSVVYFARAGIASVNGQLDDARKQGRAAIEASLATGDRHLAGLQSAMLALFLASGRDTEGAVTEAQRAHALAEELGSPGLRAMSECALGYSLSTIDPEDAIPHLEAAISTSALVANSMAHEISERCLARLRARRGDRVQALELYRNRLAHGIDAGARLPIALTCESLAVDLVNMGYHEPAATIFGALEARDDAAYRGNPIVGRNAAIEHLRDAMPDARYHHCVEAGRSMDTDSLAAFTRAALDTIIAQQVTE